MTLGRPGDCIDLATITDTQLLEEPRAVEDLAPDQYAVVLKDRHLKDCLVCETSESYTKIKMTLGTWWVRNEDWIDSNISTTAPPYLESEGFRFLPDTPLYTPPVQRS